MWVGVGRGDAIAARKERGLGGGGGGLWPTQPGCTLLVVAAGLAIPYMTLAGCMTGKMQASVSHRHTRHHAQLTDTSFAFVMIVLHMQAQQVVDIF